MSWLKAQSKTRTPSSSPTQAPKAKPATTAQSRPAGFNPAEVASKLLALRDEMNARLVGREREVWAMIVALASGEPVYYEAAPGTSKTTLAELAAAAIDGYYFYAALHENLDPDELLGPIDIVALRERGELTRRITRYLPDAEIVILDEIYRANGATLNMLIDIVLNKRVRIGNQLVPVKALTFIFAANYRRSEEEFAAFHDRLTLRVFSSYLQDKQQLLELVDKGLDILAGNATRMPKLLTADEIRAFQKHAKQAAKSVVQPVKEKLVEAVIRLRNEGIPFSDRRVVKLAYVTAVIAILNGQDTALPDDLADALRLVAPLEASDVDRVEEVIRQLGLDTASAIKQQIEALVAEGRRLASMVLEAYAKHMRGEEVDVSQVWSIVASLRNIAKELTNIVNNAEGKTERVVRAKKRIIDETLEMCYEAIRVGNKLKATA